MTAETLTFCLNKLDVSIELGQKVIIKQTELHQRLRAKRLPPQEEISQPKEKETV
jgi:hypothetical protein